jgi:peptide/nickel transport system substrate-binding protein
MRYRLRATDCFMGLLTLLVVSACSASSSPQTPSGRSDGSQQSGRTKILNLAITTDIGPLGVMGQGTTTGGWGTVSELHSAGLVTSEAQTTAFMPRLVERVPSLADGSIQLLPDGRMRVEYQIRRGVTWHDGAPFTARDMAFSFALQTDRYVSNSFNDVIKLMSSVEAVDDHTLAVTFAEPYYLGFGLVLRKFWPLPEHLLRPAYDRFHTTDNPDDVLNHPYWTSEYVHLGPFRLTAYKPGEGLELRAYDNYFLGRPKIDGINVRAFGNDDAAFASILAGGIDIFVDGALSQSWASR